MGRSNRPRRRGRPATDRGGAGLPPAVREPAVTTTRYAGQEWGVRTVRANDSGRVYRCPGCQQLIPQATPHVVAWPAHDGLSYDARLEERRHWHTGCWRAHDRRRAR